MPGINVIKTYSPNTYYHLYNRAVDKRVIFTEDDDYRLFIHLFDRYLSHRDHYDDVGRKYRKFTDDIRLVAYCLMPNHYHILIRTKEKPRVMIDFMRAHQTAFVRIYNRKHDRQGHLFQGPYRGALVSSETHKESIINYIHLNPGEKYEEYPYSSFQFYERPDSKPDWLSIQGLTL